MTRISYKRHRFPPTVIQHAVWLYFRFTLSLRNVEEMLAHRGFDVSGLSPTPSASSCLSTKPHDHCKRWSNRRRHYCRAFLLRHPTRLHQAAACTTLHKSQHRRPQVCPGELARVELMVPAGQVAASQSPQLSSPLQRVLSTGSLVPDRQPDWLHRWRCAGRRQQSPHQPDHGRLRQCRHR